MFSWVTQFFKKLFRRKDLPEVQPSFAPRRPHILIVARLYSQAREYACHHLPYHEDWRYVYSEEHLRGYQRDRVVIIKLPDWYVGKSPTFIRLVESLEVYAKRN